MNKLIKVSGVVVSVMLAGSVTMADPYRGDHGHQDYDHRDRDGGHYDGGRNYHGYNEGGRHYGYYHNGAGLLVFGLIALGITEVILSSDRPVYVQQPVVVREAPQVVYVQQPAQQAVVVQSPAQPLTMIINVQNSNGSMTPVAMRQVGNQWVGPRGEYYNNLPTVGELRGVYGF
ncbi:MAG: hypothetical protein WCS52_02970 [bacterium]